MFGFDRKSFTALCVLATALAFLPNAPIARGLELLLVAVAGLYVRRYRWLRHQPFLTAVPDPTIWAWMTALCVPIQIVSKGSADPRLLATALVTLAYAAAPMSMAHYGAVVEYPLFSRQNFGAQFVLCTAAGFAWFAFPSVATGVGAAVALVLVAWNIGNLASHIGFDEPDHAKDLSGRRLQALFMSEYAMMRELGETTPTAFVLRGLGSALLATVVFLALLWIAAALAHPAGAAAMTGAALTRGRGIGFICATLAAAAVGNTVPRLMALQRLERKLAEASAAPQALFG